MENSLCRRVVGRNVWSAVRGSAFALGVATVVACGDSTGPVDLSAVSLVAPETIHYTTEIPGGYRQIVVPVKITNATSKVINRAWCSVSLERFHLPAWESVWGQICIAALVDGPIPPGASQTVLITVTDTPPQYNGWRFTDADNDYRLRIGLYAGGDDGTAAISASLATNTFEVVP